MKSDPARIYVGNLRSEITERQLEDVFSPYGEIRSVALKQQGGMYFAFVEFEDSRDAQAAIKARHGYNLKGCILRVELPRAAAANQAKPRASTVKRLLIHGLPENVTWQELKEALKQSAGPVIFSDTKADGTSSVEVATPADVQRIARTFDGKNFTSRSGVRSTLRVTLENGEAVPISDSEVDNKWFGFPGCRPGVFV